eukprot:Nitzschia sp. Nitz4//scaffold155_size52807//10021//11112//NITZ4_006793-RA/size52807-processed-gene-0.15-mRNA-1//-1//CDS//3329537360//4147//frame0
MTQQQDAQGQLASSQGLSDLVQSKFPQDNLVHAFGYGSGVFSQTLQQGQEHVGMLDLILVVDDAQAFHQANQDKHPHHYASWLNMAGASTAAYWQRQFPLRDARVLFQVVEASESTKEPIPMKYGVVHVHDLTDDLTEWTCLYLAGRMHKPTLPLQLGNSHNTTRDALEQAQQANLQAAVAASLLLLPVQDNDNTTTPLFAWDTLYSQIAGLSYTGDFRMQVGGEDPNKIRKLVQAPGQLERFQALYNNDNNNNNHTMPAFSYSLLKPLQEKGILSCSKEGVEWDGNHRLARQELINHLPPRVQETVRPLEDASAQADALSRVLTQIVGPAAKHQSLKGVSTLGFRKSLAYAAAKLSKGLFKR